MHIYSLPFGLPSRSGHHSALSRVPSAIWASLLAQMVKSLPAMQETLVPLSRFSFSSVQFSCSVVSELPILYIVSIGPMCQCQSPRCSHPFSPWHHYIQCLLFIFIMPIWFPLPDLLSLHIICEFFKTQSQAPFLFILHFSLFHVSPNTFGLRWCWFSVTQNLPCDLQP